ncbi:hypothetical protein WA026_004073 [Henosepilachna vigintioctopunctata]|uniref:EF-hand domain-containing protein n=1 Tax=Henosepilachna vigintioctopunctata TaxID=420089 RepID=A0AAW1UGE8_9CUCU
MSEPDLLSERTLSMTQDDGIVLDDSADENTSFSKRTYGMVKAEPEINYSLTNSPRVFVPPHEVQKWFQNFEQKQDGKMNANELQQAFEIFQGKYFSDSACKFVVRLFDLDQNGGLDIREFEILYYYIKQWVSAFNAYDKDNRRALDEVQLNFALKHMDIHFSSEFIKYLITRYNPDATRIPLDQYIVTCIQIQRYTDEFKHRDIEYTGHINVGYEDFLEMVMKCV